MGLFDLFLSEEKKIKKHHRTLTNRDSQPEDREISANWLAENGGPQALLALLSRFDMNLDHQLKNQGEVDHVYALLVHIGTPAVEPLQVWLKRCKKTAMPLRLYQELAGDDQAIELVYDLLQRELERDDFKPHKKRKLLLWLVDFRHDGAIDAAAPFLKDFDETVRYAAAEVVIAQDDIAGRDPLLEALTNPEEDSNRLIVRLFEVFAMRRWPIDDADLAERVPDGYAIRDGRVFAA